MACINIADPVVVVDSVTGCRAELLRQDASSCQERLGYTLPAPGWGTVTPEPCFDLVAA